MSLRINNLVLGEGRPKICVPITAKTDTELKEQLKMIWQTCFMREKPCADLLEWRADFWGDWSPVSWKTQLKEVVMQIQEAFPGLPLLFTFRSKAEGGEREIAGEDYEELCRMVIEEKIADLLDIELFARDGAAKRLLSDYGEDRDSGQRKPKEWEKPLLLVSSHDFRKTPSKEEMMDRLMEMEQLGADILKLAVMPQKAEDVLRLLEVTREIKGKTDKPVITMSMGRLGLVSRLTGEIFGSAVTFGSAGCPSAPGQIEAGMLLEILDLFSQERD